MSSGFERSVVQRVLGFLRDGPDLLQVIVGPRQVGKTWAARDIERQWPGPARYAAADDFLPPGPEWVHAQWDLARRDARDGTALLVLDEVQKVPRWSEVVKAEWDADRRGGVPLKVLILGSSALLLARGTTESLAGRFFLHRCPHWSWPECRQAFGWDLDRWIFFGGYPGSAPFAGDETAWKAYVRDSLIEAVLARDVLALERVARPALLRQLFALACRYPAQPLSYNKMLGQLQDAGNTTTLAHYLRLLDQAFLVAGLEPFSPAAVRSRGGSPKLVARNNALVSAMDPRPFAVARADGEWWGRLVENAVGGHLLNRLQGMPFEVAWWRDRGDEVDFVVGTGRGTWAVEVKSARAGRVSGLARFIARHPGARPLVVGPGGMAMEEFFAAEPAEVFG